MPIRKNLILFIVLLVSCAGDDDDANTVLRVTWKFASGDCAQNQIDKVRVTLAPSGGTATGIPKEFACTVGTGEVGTITKGSFSINGEALDATGKVRFTSTHTTTFPDGKVAAPLDLTLRPKASNVTVTWNGCPASFVLPYQVTIYREATTGGGLGTKVKDTQEPCQSKKAVLDAIAPGAYVVEVDSRATSPAVKGTQRVTVVAGEDIEVNVPVP